MNIPVGPWAILRDHLENYTQVDVPDLMVDADTAEADAMYAARAQAQPRRGSMAVLPIFGPITKRDSVMTMLFGGTSTNRLIAQIGALAKDDTISTVLLNVDSPGGSAAGLSEAAEAIRRLRSQKRVVALVNDVATSAAYWLASQASEVIGTPVSLTGSIGVYLMHIDYSAALEQEGIDVTYIASSQEKTEGNPYEPLTDDAREHLQAIVDSTYALFVKDVAKGRGIKASAVKSDFGNGVVFTAKDALEAGLIDGIATYTETLERVARASRGGRMAEGETPEPKAGQATVRLRVETEIVEEDDKEVTHDDEVLEENAFLPSLDRRRFRR